MSVTSPFSPFTTSLRSGHSTYFVSDQPIKGPIISEYKVQRMHLLVCRAETKSSINADLSLRRPLVVFCNSFHQSLELFSSRYLWKSTSDDSKMMILVLFIRRRQLDQSSSRQPAL